MDGPHSQWTMAKDLCLSHHGVSHHLLQACRDISMPPYLGQKKQEMNTSGGELSGCFMTSCEAEILDDVDNVQLKYSGTYEYGIKNSN